MSNNNKMNDQEFVPKPKQFHYVFSILASWLVSLFPSFFLINRNYSLLGSDDLWMTIGIVSLHWLLVFLICLLIFRNGHKASLATILAIVPLSLFNGGLNFIQKIVPGFFYWHALLSFIVLFGVFCFVIYHHLNKESAFKLNIIFGAIFLALSVYNLAPSAFKAIKTEKTQGNTPSLVHTSVDLDGATREKRPNIYLFIFDEYSGPEALERYYKYNNQKFYDRLIELGFNISKTSRNYVALTKVEIPNLLNLSTDGFEYTEVEKDTLMQDPYLFRLLKSLGYDLNLINDQNFISTPNALFKYRFESQGIFQVDESLLTLLIDKSVYFPFRSVVKGARLREIHEMFNYGAQSSKLQESNLFTLGYIMFPHNPFVVDEHGNDLSVSLQREWRNPDIYLGQFKYADVLITKLVEEILENDPNSCVLLMSDHASRQIFRMEMNAELTIEDRDLENYYARNILNVAYLAGEKMDIEGFSGINTVRAMLDRLFKLDLGLIEEAE